MVQVSGIDDVFERYVNSKDNQTAYDCHEPYDVFERYVNSKDNQTIQFTYSHPFRLRDM